MLALAPLCSWQKSMNISCKLTSTVFTGAASSSGDMPPNSVPSTSIVIFVLQQLKVLDSTHAFNVITRHRKCKCMCVDRVFHYKMSVTTEPTNFLIWRPNYSTHIFKSPINAELKYYKHCNLIKHDFNCIMFDLIVITTCIFFFFFIKS